MGTFIILLALLCSISSTTAMETVYMQSRCNDKKDISKSTALRVEATKWSYYTSDSDCMLTITTQTTYGMLIEFQDLSMESSSDCKFDRLIMYDGASNAQNQIGIFCGSYTPIRVYATSRNRLTLFFHSDKYTEGSGFEIIITPYHTGNCTSSDMSCSNGRCVDERFRCTGYSPCGDTSGCPVAHVKAYGVTIGVSTSSIITICLCCSIWYYCCKRRGGSSESSGSSRSGGTDITISTITVKS